MNGRKSRRAVQVFCGIVMCAAGLLRADDLPKAAPLSRYQPMLDRSPFAVATAAAPAPPPAANFAKDLYVANAAHASDCDRVTVASSTDKNFKLYLTSCEPVDGYSIAGIEWSERVGATKVTLSKDGQFAPIGFNEALLSQPIAPGAGAPPMPQPNPGGPPSIPMPAPPISGATGTTTIHPAPVPGLPTPPPRVRSAIPRNPRPQPDQR